MSASEEQHKLHFPLCGTGTCTVPTKKQSTPRSKKKAAVMMGLTAAITGGPTLGRSFSIPGTLTGMQGQPPVMGMPEAPPGMRRSHSDTGDWVQSRGTATSPHLPIWNLPLPSSSSSTFTNTSTIDPTPAEYDFKPLYAPINSTIMGTNETVGLDEGQYNTYLYNLNDTQMTEESRNICIAVMRSNETRNDSIEILQDSTELATTAIQQHHITKHEHRILDDTQQTRSSCSREHVNQLRAQAYSAFEDVMRQRKTGPAEVLPAAPTPPAATQGEELPAAPAPPAATQGEELPAAPAPTQLPAAPTPPAKEPVPYLESLPSFSLTADATEVQDRERVKKDICDIEDQVWSSILTNDSDAATCVKDNVSTKQLVQAYVHHKICEAEHTRALKFVSPTSTEQEGERTEPKADTMNGLKVAVFFGTLLYFCKIEPKESRRRRQVVYPGGRFRAIDEWRHPTQSKRGK